MKGGPTVSENIVANDTSNKGLISNIYKGLNKTQYQEDKQSN